MNEQTDSIIKYHVTNAEEKVFTIPELRMHILSYIIEPEIEENIVIKSNNCEKIKSNLCCCCLLPCIICKLYEYGILSCCCC